MKYLKLFENFNELGEVFFNKETYPGYHYVKEILPKYKMYLMPFHGDNYQEIELVKDDEMNSLYWLVMPDGSKFGWELRDNRFYDLDRKEQGEYFHTNRIFPTNTINP